MGGIFFSDMYQAFSFCSNLGYTATDHPNLNNTANLSYMFQNATSFNGDVGNWDLTGIRSLEGIFWGALSFNQDISSWDVSSVTNMERMFYNSPFNQNLGKWDISSVTDMTNIFTGGFHQPTGRYGLSIANYDSTLIAWQAKVHQLNVPLGAQGLEYCLSDSSRTLLITDGWVFTGDTINCLGISIDEQKIITQFSIYPNPSKGVVNIETSANIDNQEIQILNSLGQIVKSVFIVGEKSIQVDLNDLPKGLYYVKQNNQVHKLILTQ